MNHIVLFKPDIPQNTGNIMRTCVAFGMRLHLIRPLGFSLDESRLKRSALDYLDNLDYRVWDSLDAFFDENEGACFYTSRYGERPPDVHDFDVPGEVFVFFGNEQRGLPKSLLRANRKRLIRIPTTDGVRTLNLACSVAIVAHEVVRQQGFKGLYRQEPPTLKGPNYLDE